MLVSVKNAGLCRQCSSLAFIPKHNEARYVFNLNNDNLFYFINQKKIIEKVHNNGWIFDFLI